MPVTAKLSRKFYDTLGDDIANELVEWLNAVDLTYRTELRELNELNHGRFEAKLSEGLNGLRAELERQIAVVRSDLERQIGELRSELKQEIAQARMATEAIGSQLRMEMAVMRSDLIKWMFLFWLGTIAVSIANNFF